MYYATIDCTPTYTRTMKLIPKVSPTMGFSLEISSASLTQLFIVFNGLVGGQSHKKYDITITTAFNSGLLLFSDRRNQDAFVLSV